MKAKLAKDNSQKQHRLKVKLASLGTYDKTKHPRDEFAYTKLLANSNGYSLEHGGLKRVCEEYASEQLRADYSEADPLEAGAGTDAWRISLWQSEGRERSELCLAGAK